MKGHARKYICVWVLVLGVITLASGLSQAQDIKARMKARLPVINELKAKGIIGETNTGYLAYLGSVKEHADVIEAENRDRRLVYEAIARKTGVSAEVVGRRRARKIASIALPGHWLQDEKGRWYQKK